MFHRYLFLLSGWGTGASTEGVPEGYREGAIAGTEEASNVVLIARLMTLIERCAQFRRVVMSCGDAVPSVSRIDRREVGSEGYAWGLACQAMGAVGITQ